MERDRPWLSPPLIAVALFAVLLAGYVSGYLLRGRVATVPTSAGVPGRTRTFPSWVEAQLFGPSAFVESLILGRDVYIGWDP